MTEGFVSSYADILYTPAAVQHLVASPADIALLVDTDWRERYRPRTQHPESDGEKVRLTGERVTAVGWDIPPWEAPAEFTGVAKFSRAARGSWPPTTIAPSRPTTMSRSHVGGRSWKPT